MTAAPPVLPRASSGTSQQRPLVVQVQLLERLADLALISTPVPAPALKSTSVA